MANSFQVFVCACILYACVQWPVLGDDLLSAKLDEKLKKKVLKKKQEGRTDGRSLTVCHVVETESRTHREFSHLHFSSNCLNSIISISPQM